MGKKSRLKRERRELKEHIDVAANQSIDQDYNLKKPSGNGVYVGAGASVRFIGTTFRRNSGSGANIHKDADVKFYGCDLSNNEMNGVTVSCHENDNLYYQKERVMSQKDSCDRGRIHLEGNIARNNKGAGYLFDKNSNVTAIKNLSEGNLEGFVVASTEESQHLKGILNEVLLNVESWKLSAESREDLQLDIDTIKAQLAAREPKRIIIRESLISIKNIAYGVASNTVFQGIILSLDQFSS